MGSEAATAGAMDGPDGGADAPVGSAKDPRRTGPADDDAIVSAIAEKNYREALTLSARLHGASIGRLCMALVGSQAEAEELAQEALLDAHHAFASFRGTGTVRAFLFSIARRKCARHLELRSRRSARLHLVHDAPEPNAGDDLVARRERAAHARRALERVRPSERDALALRYVAELDYHEIAEILDIDAAAARKRVSRALAKLRDVLGTED